MPNGSMNVPALILQRMRDKGVLDDAEYQRLSAAVPQEQDYGPQYERLGQDYLGALNRAREVGNQPIRPGPRDIVGGGLGILMSALGNAVSKGQYRNLPIQVGQQAGQGWYDRATANRARTIDEILNQAGTTYELGTSALGRREAADTSKQKDFSSLLDVVFSTQTPTMTPFQEDESARAWYKLQHPETDRSIPEWQVVPPNLLGDYYQQYSRRLSNMLPGEDISPEEKELLFNAVVAAPAGNYAKLFPNELGDPNTIDSLRAGAGLPALQKPETGPALGSDATLQNFIGLRNRLAPRRPPVSEPPADWPGTREQWLEWQRMQGNY